MLNFNSNFARLHQRLCSHVHIETCSLRMNAYNIWISYDIVILCYLPSNISKHGINSTKARRNRTLIVDSCNYFVFSGCLQLGWSCGNSWWNPEICQQSSRNLIFTMKVPRWNFNFTACVLLVSFFFFDRWHCPRYGVGGGYLSGRSAWNIVCVWKWSNSSFKIFYSKCKHD